LLLLDKNNRYYEKVVELTKKLLDKYMENCLSEKHELACIMRLHQAIEETKVLNEYEKKMYDKLKAEVNSIIDPVEEWDKGYMTTPFAFPIINNQYDIPIELINTNIKFLENSIINDHWNVTWTWMNDDPAFEMQAIKWQAVLAIKNLRNILAFQGKIKP
jgi:hypothetical protein